MNFLPDEERPPHFLATALEVVTGHDILHYFLYSNCEGHFALYSHHTFRKTGHKKKLNTLLQFPDQIDLTDILPANDDSDKGLCQYWLCATLQ